MAKNKGRRQPVARSLERSRPIHNLNVSLSDQKTFNLFSRSVEGLTPDSQSAFIGEVLRAGLELKQVVRLRCALVLVDDSGVKPLRLQWYPGTYLRLGDLPYAYDSTIWCSGDPNKESGAALAIEKCSPVVGEYQYLAAFGTAGDPDEDDWAVVAVEEVETVKLRDGTYVSVAEFHAYPLAYLLAIS